MNLIIWGKSMGVYNAYALPGFSLLVYEPLVETSFNSYKPRTLTCDDHWMQKPPQILLVTYGSLKQGARISCRFSKSIDPKQGSFRTWLLDGSRSD